MAARICSGVPNVACRWTENARSKVDSQSITSISGFPSNGASSRVGREVSMQQYWLALEDVINWLWVEFRNEISECCNIAQKVGLGLALSWGFDETVGTSRSRSSLELEVDDWEKLR